jgi:hypothetical protein
MEKIFKNKYFPPVFFLVLALIILWQMLRPGYVLTLDMVFTPQLDPSLAQQGFYNTAPLWLVLKAVNLAAPGWVLQKFLLIGLFFSMGVLAFYFLPVPERIGIKIFSATFFTLNPFVYGRFLAGHWLVLWAYAILPFFLYSLILFFERPSQKHTAQLYASMLLLGLFSLHILIMSAVVLVIFFVCNLVRSMFAKDSVMVRKIVLYLAGGGIFFLIVSSYWLIPAAVHHNELLFQQFTAAHWQAFAASGHGKIPVLLNLVILNGFWGEGNLWVRYFVWPQDSIAFWIGAICIGCLVIAGGIYYFRKRPSCAVPVFLMIVVFLVFATGAADTPYKGFNIWFYEHIPFWSGFRDSQKFISFVALGWSVLAGWGLEALLKIFSGFRAYIGVAGAVAVVLIGFLPLVGFRGQLQPIWYPDSWNKVKQIIDTSGGDTLILPWHGYLSLAFNDNLIVANPARDYFGPHVVVSKDVELGDVYSQESDPGYIELDRIIAGKSLLGDDQIVDYLFRHNIRYIVSLEDLKIVAYQYGFLKSSHLQSIGGTEPLKIYKIFPAYP